MVSSGKIIKYVYTWGHIRHCACLTLCSRRLHCTFVGIALFESGTIPCTQCCINSYDQPVLFQSEIEKEQ